MTIICQCNHITDQQVREALAEDADRLYALPEHKRAALIFNKLRETKSQSSKAMCEKCPKPCRANFLAVVIEEDEKRCKGYQSPGGCLAADILAGYLHEMK